MLAHLLHVFLGLSTAAGQGFDQSAYSALLEEVVSPQGVDYGALSEKSGQLASYLQRVAAATPGEMSTAERTAFWINAYNATTLKLVIDHLPLASIRDLDEGRVWDTRATVVGGERLTLNQLENERLRPLGDPRIHAALNCAAKGCPPLRASAYEAAELEAALEGAVETWVRGGGVVLDRPRQQLRLSQVFKWYGEDFVSPPGAPGIPGIEATTVGALHFLGTYLAPADAAWMRAGGYRVVFLDYDWALNAR